MGKLRYSGRLFAQLLGLARAQRAYWIVPAAIMLGFAAALIVGSGVMTPLIYTIF